MKVQIEKIIPGGWGLGRIDGKVVFVPYTCRGEEVAIEITKSFKDYTQARIINIIKSSSERVTPLCPVYTQCGGCHFQHFSYDEEQEVKREFLAEICSLSLHEVCSEFYPAPTSFHYRHRIRLHIARFGKNRKPGFLARESHQVIPVDKCLLAHHSIGKLQQELEPVSTAMNKENGMISVEILYSSLEKKFLLGLNLDGDNYEGKGLSTLLEKWPQIKGISWRNPGMKSDGYVGENRLAYEIQPDLSGYMGSFRFSQANLKLNQTMVEYCQTLVKKRALKLGGKANLLELFAGSGNFTLPLAKVATQIIATEIAPLSVKDLKECCQREKITNVQVIQGKSWLILKQVVEKGDNFDIIFLDPPRQGIKEERRYILALKPGYILYLSCHLATLKRDVNYFLKHGYSLDRAVGFDLFPRTHHLEILAVLNLESEFSDRI